MEWLTGGRLTTSYTRVGGLSGDIPDGWIPELRRFVEYFPPMIDEFEKLLTRNRIWMQRTQNVGVIPRQMAIEYGVTGPSLRAAGVDYDVRKAIPYCGYEKYDFEIPIGSVGDVYDRYLVRLEEMRQSVRILDQAVKNLPDGPINVDDGKVFSRARRRS
jgi:NADH-quinone oxidoreductase subunit D